MTIKRVISAAVVILAAVCLPASAHAQTAIFTTDPAAATISDRSIACEAFSSPPIVSTITISGAIAQPIFFGVAANVTGHGAITVSLENSDGHKVAFINEPYDDELPSSAFLELLISSVNPKEEGPLQKNDTVESHLQYLISPTSFSTGAVVFTLRGLLANAEIQLFGFVGEAFPFRCSGAGMVQIRFPFSLSYK